MTPPRRPTTFYRMVLVLPILMLVYLVVSGRLAAYWHAFSRGGGALIVVRR